MNGGSGTDLVRYLYYPNTELGADNFPSNPSRSGSGSNTYIFAGWNTSSNGTGKFLTASTKVLGDYASATSLTVYAQWVPAPSGSYTTVYFWADNDTTKAPWAVKAVTATTIESNIPASSPTRRNDNFNGWYTSAYGGTAVNASTTVSGPTMNVFAHWTGTSNNDSSLSAPTGLSASVSGSSITLSWSSVSGATSYKVYRSSSSSGSYSLLYTTYTYSYTDSGLSAGTYYYKVSAVSSSGTESTQSSTASATVTSGGGFPPSSSTLLSVGSSWTSGNLSTGGVNWYRFEASSGNSYRVYWYDKDGDSGGSGSGNYTADIKVSGYTSSSETAFFTTDIGHTTPQNISGRSGTIYLKVEGNNTNSNGTYAIRVTQ
jgi:uncharacterized repeat protein (TIGR02543 family)